MAVAVKNASEAAPKGLLDRLAVSSLVGAVYVLGSIGILFYGVPRLWQTAFQTALDSALGSFMNFGLMSLCMLAIGIGLVLIGVRRLGPHPPHGLKAGIFTAAAGLVGIGLVTVWIGDLLESSAFNGESSQPIGLILTWVIGIGLLIAAGRWFFKPAAEEFLIQFEDQGWFSTEMYKRSQGQRVRRGTILGILAIAATGIWTLYSHHALEAGDPRWSLHMPFTDGQYLVYLSDVRFSVPVILAALSLWLAFRIVNFPAFADFLIATEAELNKVSWTTRKRLVQDTIVVLTCVILLTVFLFVVDLLWGYLLSSKYVGVIRVEQSTIEKESKEQDY